MGLGERGKSGDTSITDIAVEETLTIEEIETERDKVVVKPQSCTRSNATVEQQDGQVEWEDIFN